MRAAIGMPLIFRRILTSESLNLARTPYSVRSVYDLVRLRQFPHVSGGTGIRTISPLDLTTTPPPLPAPFPPPSCAGGNVCTSA